MKKRMIGLLLCLLPMAALAEQEAVPVHGPLTIEVSQTETGDSHLEAFIPSFESDTAFDEEQLAEISIWTGEVQGRVYERFMVDEAAQASRRAGAKVTQEASVYQDGEIASMVLTWKGTQADGSDGCAVLTMALDLTTGEEITFDRLFADPEAAAAAMEAVIEEEILAAMSDYMEYADLLPMPRDSFGFDENGLTVYYPDDRYRYFGGMSGSVHFAWYELEDFIGEDSPVRALAAAQPADGQAIETAVSSGRFGGAMPFGLGDRLGDALHALTLLADPDYTKDAMVYLFEEARLRGWALEIPRYADTDEEDTPVSAVRASRISWHGLTTGRTARGEIVALLGEPERTKSIDEDTAFDMMLEPGESLLYRFGEHVLQAHVDGNGVLSCLILRDSMPEEGLY